MAIRLKDKDQKALIKMMAKEIGTSENHLLSEVVEMGFTTMLMARKGKAKEATEELNKLFDENPTWMRAAQLLEINWEAGAIKEEPKTENHD